LLRGLIPLTWFVKKKSKSEKTEKPENAKVNRIVTLSRLSGISIVKARTGSTVVAAGTTMPGTADRRIVTTTNRRTGTTTWAFAL